MKTPLLPGNVARTLVRAFVHFYYPTIEVSNRERIPTTGPVLLVANHPNSLLDPPIVGWVARRPVHFFTKAPLFQVPVFGAVLHALGMVPAYRGSDDPSQVRKNLDTLKVGAEFLVKGEAVGLFPEGKSHDLTRVEMIRTGAARLALQAVTSGANVCIVPIGLNHERKERFRSAVWVQVGRPLDAAALLREHEGQERPALRHITNEIETRLQEVVVHLEEPQWQPFLYELEVLLPAQGNATDDPIASLRQRKLIAEAMNYWLAADRPRAEATASAILEHRARLTEAGITIDSQILRLQRPAMTRYLVVEPLKLIPGLVPALAGLIHHIIPFAITRLLARFSKFPGRAWLATGRLLCSVPIYFIWYAVVWWALARSTKPWIAWTWTALMPFAGIIAWHYWQHATELLRLWRQEVRVFLRPDALESLRSEQSELRAKLHSLAEDYRKRPKSPETSAVA